MAEGRDIALKDRVIVVGGGNMAVDVALTARRCGAREVTMVCLESREEMPAHEWEIAGALEEGVQLMPSWGPRKVLNDNGRVTGLAVIQCTSVFDENGNFAPAFCDTSDTVAGDQIIMAIGQASDLSFLPDGGPVLVNHGLIVVNDKSLETGMPGVYAGGDVVKVPGSIIHAIAAGRLAASSIDQSLGGDGEIGDVLFERAEPNQHIGREEGFAFKTREKVPELSVNERIRGFREVALGYDEDQAMREAKRCLQCDLRLFMECNPSPPEKLLAFNEENLSQVPEAEGVFQLYDEDHNILSIKGTANMQRDLLQQMEDGTTSAWFDFEEDKMYSKRESELMQQYLQEHGEMPGGSDSDMDDLF